MTGWNGLDFLIFLILAANTILGLSRGATKEIISLMCLSAALIFCIEFTLPLTRFFNSSPAINDVVTSTFIQNFMLAIDAGPLTEQSLNEIMYSISLLICFAGVFSICEAGLSMKGFTDVFSFPYAILNRKIGGVLGFTRGYIICLIFLSILAMHLYKDANNSQGRDIIANSFFANLFATQVHKLDSLISEQQVESYHELYQDQPYSPEELYKKLHTPRLPMQQQPLAPQTQPLSTQQQ